MKWCDALLGVDGVFSFLLSVPAAVGLELFFGDVRVIWVALGGLGVSSIVMLGVVSSLITVFWGASISPSTSELASGGSLPTTVISSLGRSLLANLIGCWAETFVHLERGFWGLLRC